jgi:hypothetical protein
MPKKEIIAKDKETQSRHRIIYIKNWAILCNDTRAILRTCPRCYVVVTLTINASSRRNQMVLVPRAASQPRLRLSLINFTA